MDKLEFLRMIYKLLKLLGKEPIGIPYYATIYCTDGEQTEVFVVTGKDINHYKSGNPNGK